MQVETSQRVVKDVVIHEYRNFNTRGLGPQDSRVSTTLGMESNFMQEIVLMLIY